LLVGLTASVLAHALLILPFLFMAMTSESKAMVMEGRFDPDDFHRPEEIEEQEAPPQEPEVELGIDADTPSSLTWVGYEEYQEHLARLAEVDQAAFTEQPVVAGGGSEAPAPVETETPPAPAPTMPTPPELLVEAESETTPEQDSETPTEAPPEEAVTMEVETPEPEELQPQQPAVPVAVAINEQTLSPVSTLLDRLFIASAEQPQTPEEPLPEQPEAPPKQPKPAEKPTPPPTPRPEPETKPPTPPTAPAPPKQTPGKPGDPAKPEVGDRAEKESDAFSKIEVTMDEIKLGKPIARPGLELRPRRPRLTNLQMVTTGGCSPIVKISFDNKGVPVYPVKILRSQCDSRVLKAIESSLYRWRASGKEIRALGAKETIDIEITIFVR
jgi:hypothetical protein